MQITPNRANQYRVPSQAKPSAPVRFGGNENFPYVEELRQLEDVVDQGVRLTFKINEDEMTPKAQAKHLHERADFLNALADRLKARSQKALQNAVKFDPSLKPPAVGAAAGSEKPKEAESTKPAEAPSSQQGDQENAPAANVDTAKPKWTPRNERTRWSVAKDVTKQYFTGGKVLWDLGMGAVVGALFAIGSPVMVVTIPTAWAVYGGWRLIQLAWKMGHDPKGDKIDAMYKKW